DMEPRLRRLGPGESRLAPAHACEVRVRARSTVRAEERGRCAAAWAPTRARDTARLRRAAHRSPPQRYRVGQTQARGALLHGRVEGFGVGLAAGQGPADDAGAHRR